MYSLHHHDPGAGLRVVEACAHHLAMPFDHFLPLQDRFGFLDVVGIVDDDAIATFASIRAVDGARQTMAAAVVVEPSFFILIGGQNEPVAPVTLIPGRLDKPPALHRVPDAESFRIARKHPTPLRMPDPLPSGPEYRNRERLHVPRGDRDQQVADLA